MLIQAVALARRSRQQVPVFWLPLQQAAVRAEGVREMGESNHGKLVWKDYSKFRTDTASIVGRSSHASSQYKLYAVRLVSGTSL